MGSIFGHLQVILPSTLAAFSCTPRVSLPEDRLGWQPSLCGARRISSVNSHLTDISVFLPFQPHREPSWPELHFRADGHRQQAAVWVLPLIFWGQGLLLHPKVGRLVQEAMWMCCSSGFELTLSSCCETLFCIYRWLLEVSCLCQELGLPLRRRGASLLRYVSGLRKGSSCAPWDGHMINGLA